MVAEVLDKNYSHAEIDSIFRHADAPGDPPAGGKLAKCGAWLDWANKWTPCDPIAIPGGVLERFMETDRSMYGTCETREADRERIRAALAKHGLSYEAGGRIVRGGRVAAPTRDIRTIVGGLAAVVSGIGALRTHTGSAHGKGRAPFPLAPRHARLAVHAAHTLLTYLIERWESEKPKAKAR